MREQEKINAYSEGGYRSGFVALVGRPNTGKSTLVNSLVKYPVSITANKPQTTRTNVRGIITTDTYQAVLVDTPGIHEPSSQLHNRIVSYALSTVKDSDIVMMVAEPVTFGGNICDDDKRVIAALQKAQGPVFLIMNKIDLYRTELMMNNTALFLKEYPFREVLPVSALKKKGLERLDRIFTHLPPGKQLYPEDIPTDMPLKALAAEIIRESIFNLTSQEIPYSCAVEMEKFEELPGLCRIYASIVVAKDSHKKMIIGRQGQTLKRIGTRSRLKIQMLTLKQAYLTLHVKVMDRWYDNSRSLDTLGYN